MEDLFTDTIILVYTTNCPACKQVKPLYRKLLSDDKLNYIEINVDENPLVKELFRIKSVPVLIFVKNKTEINRLTGITTAEQVKEALVGMEE